MKLTNQVKFIYVIVCLAILFLGNNLYRNSVNFIYPTLYQIGKQSDSPKSVKMYYLIEKYSDQFNIPKYIAYNVAFLETGYKGPFHWKYNPHQVSSAGALGPMQIMPKTGKWLTEGKSTSSKLKNDIELNVMLRMKMLNWLYKKYGDWGICCGYYNTGYPKLNDYAIYCVSNTEYTDKWIKPNVD